MIEEIFLCVVLDIILNEKTYKDTNSTAFYHSFSCRYSNDSPHSHSNSYRGDSLH